MEYIFIHALFCVTFREFYKSLYCQHPLLNIASLNTLTDFLRKILIANIDASPTSDSSSFLSRPLHHISCGAVLPNTTNFRYQSIITKYYGAGKNNNGTIAHKYSININPLQISHRINGPLSHSISPPKWQWMSLREESIKLFCCRLQYQENKQTETHCTRVQSGASWVQEEH